MRSLRLALPALAGAAVLAACAGPAGTSSDGSTNEYTPPPEGGAAYGPGDLCTDTYVIVQQEPTESNTRTNFSLGAENYRNDDFCAAYPYVQWLLANDPLFTGEDPDDRNYLRMASIYEYFAQNVDSTDQATRVAYLDSARAVRQEGRQTLDTQGIAYDPYLRDLREGFFYFQNRDVYDDADQQQFEAFNRAFEAQPDSLDDWYYSQLFALSGNEFGDEFPNPQRADYVERLASNVDTPALQQYLTSSAEFFRTDPSAAPGGVAGAGSDAAVEQLVADLQAGTISDDDALTLLAVVLQQPDRLEALGEDPAALQTQVVRLPAITNQVDNPRTLVALAFQAFREGDTARGNELFDRGLTNAASNAQRADFLYARSAEGFGNTSQLVNRALQYFPSHGPSLYARAGMIADAVGRPSSLTGRFAYWCLADEYRNVAAVTSGRIADAARRAAAGYERAGPSRESYFLEGYRPGQTVTASLGAYGSCSTRVR
ncbi:hypothetical protein [Rubrivirga litoralis]|uniref:Tetratricopeptide repeat protein n=1 Tax=Rubrivirga litoralis TaxID=3075598 RepID=A0ABU3BQQ7_9BACT|nr:hypothetical protein [Rubrivirga sp. F394]MDT0631622.1 hypothetical protein [Rubrivirga sp. F394]